MLADWRPISSKILESLGKCNLDKIEELILRDLLISRRRRLIDPEPQWALLPEIPLASGEFFDLKSARITASLKGNVREIAILARYLVGLLAGLFSPNPYKKPSPRPATLFFSDGLSDFSRPLFDEFMQEARFKSILRDDELIVQDRNVWRKIRIGNSIYVKDIGVYLFSNLLTKRERASFLGKLSKQLLNFRRFERFGFIGISKLAVERNLWDTLLSRIGKTSLLATTSYREILPTPFYLLPITSGKRYLLWYSNNNFSSPSQDGIDVIDNRIDFSCRSEIDVHFVWTSDFADSIRGRNKEVEIQVVGSLMMYPKRVIEPLEGYFKIALFDMTPWEGYPPTMFGSELFMESFIKDIVEVSQEFDSVRIYLKPKRKYVRSGSGFTHSASYLALIDEYSSKKKLNLLDPNTNIYGICDRADLILGFPFASPAIVGHELSKPSFYYNPEFSKHWKIRQSMDNVSVISGKENLRIKIQEIYDSKNSGFNQS